MNTIRFTKMHGLGNDFMVIDGINQTFTPDKNRISQWANRHTGIGFDQLLLVERSARDGVDFRYRIFNADGGEVEQCGNGARCFARFVYEKGLTDKREIVVETAHGLIVPRIDDNGWVRVNMGAPQFSADSVPFVLHDGELQAALSYAVAHGDECAEMAILGMGNPHAVMRVDDVAQAAVEKWGAALQRHGRFPARVNVGFMQVLDRKHIRLRVFERGVGETLACGTGACAAVVAGVRWGILPSGEAVHVSLRGGDLLVRWQAGDDVYMTGAAVSVFDGAIEIDG